MTRLHPHGSKAALLKPIGVVKDLAIVELSGSSRQFYGMLCDSSLIYLLVSIFVPCH